MRMILHTSFVDGLLAFPILSERSLLLQSIHQEELMEYDHCDQHFLWSLHVTLGLVDFLQIVDLEATDLCHYALYIVAFANHCSRLSLLPDDSNCVGWPDRIVGWSRFFFTVCVLCWGRCGVSKSTFYLYSDCAVVLVVAPVCIFHRYPFSTGLLLLFFLSVRVSPRSVANSNLKG